MLTMEKDLHIPPVNLRYRVHGSTDVPDFLRVGETICSNILGILEQQRIRASFKKILDFGCGSGRVLKYLAPRLPFSRFWASDIDREAIYWCQHQLSHHAHFGINEEMPPTAFSEDYFDFIYAISVFTHLNAKEQQAWLEELRRICKPGGVALFSIHGPHCHSDLSQADHRLVLERGCFLKIWPNWRVSYQTKAWTLAQFSKCFEIIGYLERGINNHQDVVLMRKEAIN